MDDSHTHAICNVFESLSNEKKHSFLLLTKRILELQLGHDFSFINEPTTDALNEYPSVAFDSSKYYLIPEIYQKYNIFLDIKSLINKTTKIKKLNPKLSAFFESKEDQALFKKFINIIVLVNLIRKQLKKKSPENIANYDLFNKLNKINANMVSLLQLEDVQNATTQDQIKAYINETYDYQNVDVFNLIETITDEEYYKVYEEFELYV